MKKNFLFWVAIFIIFDRSVANAQTYSGLRNDAFTPITSLSLNPAAIFGSPMSWEINLAAVGAAVNNNYLYYDHQSASGLSDYDQAHNALPQPSFYKVTQARGFVDGLAMGPSAIFRFKNFSLGFIDNERWLVSATSDNSASQMLQFYQLPPYTENRIPPFHADYLNFGEVGINLGKPLAGKNLFGAITIKYLMGYDAASVQNTVPFHYYYDSTNAHVSNFDGTFAFTNPVGKGIYSYGPRTWLGHGTSADIGILKLGGVSVDDQRTIPYKWKFGASVTDIGMMRYSTTSFTYDVSSANTFLIPLPELQKTVDLYEVVKLGAQHIYDKNKPTVASFSFIEFLPATANIQFDYSLSQKWWMNVTAMQRLHIFNNQIVRPNILMIAPRYQTRFFTVNLPLTIFDYDQLHVGLSMRAGFLTLGSDNVPALFVPGKFSGGDVYASLVIFPWKIQKELHGILHFHNKKDLTCPKI